MIHLAGGRYEAGVNPRCGTLEWLRTDGDPEGINLIHKSAVTAFGALAVTSSDQPPRMGPSRSPIGVESVLLEETRLFGSLEFFRENLVLCRHPRNDVLWRYSFGEDGIDLEVQGEVPGAEQVAVDCPVAFMDLRQTDSPEFQFNLKSFYRSDDRKLCYVYLERPRGPGILIHSLTPCAGWRLLYATDDHAVQGLQMVARWDSRLSPEDKPGPFAFGIRVSFHETLAEAREFLLASRRIPLISSPTPAVDLGAEVPLEVVGEFVRVVAEGPDGGEEEVRLARAGGHRRVGSFVPWKEGFYRVRAHGEAGSSHLVAHAGATFEQSLERTTRGLEPHVGGFAESQYPLQAMLLARTLCGADAQHDAFLYTGLNVVRMQGIEGVPGPPYHPGNEAVARALAVPSLSETGIYPHLGREEGTGWFLYQPVPFEHEFNGRWLHKHHIYKWERVQDQFEDIRTFLYAARAYGNDRYFEHAMDLAHCVLADHLDELGRVYCLHLGGSDKHDYTTVICPMQVLVELLEELEERGDGRAAEIRAACRRMAGYLMQRGFEFPTEGVSVHLRWTEDGSIACTALALLEAYHHVERCPEWLRRAEAILRYHEPWRMDVPDARCLDSSYRYWEAQWENDGEGRSINCGHPWTLWRAEALFLLALATGSPQALVQSYNGFRTNLVKVHASGHLPDSFTPDYLPQRPRRMQLVHSYPERPSCGTAFYLWPRLRRTWWGIGAVVALDGRHEASSLLALQGVLEFGSDGWRFKPTQPGLRRLVVCGTFPENIQVDKPEADVEVVRISQDAATVISVAEPEVAITHSR